MSYVFLLAFFQLPPIFTLVDASICHFRSAATKKSCFPSKEIRPLCCFCCCCFSLSRFRCVSVNTLKLSRKKDSALQLFLSLEKSRWPCDLPPKRCGYLKCGFYSCLREGVDLCTYGRTILSETKFLDAYTYLADSIKDALGIGNCELGRYCCAHSSKPFHCSICPNA